MTKNTQNSHNRHQGLALYLDLGLRFALAISLGVGGGYWLDSKLHTMPLFLIIGLFLGAASGFLSIYRTVYQDDSTKAGKGE
ncbi:MAG: AtpZ/AtpI family protein [bacterium]